MESSSSSILLKNEMLSLSSDPDIAEESKVFSQLHLNKEETKRSKEESKCPFAHLWKSSEEKPKKIIKNVRLHMSGRTYQKSYDTKKLLREVGGLNALRKMTRIFYHDKFFKDPFLVKFINDQSDPHEERLATWVAEKMGEGNPWTKERMTRDSTPKIVANNQKIVVHDRSSAHAAAWWSRNREPEKVGRRFKLDDSRIWMRLHFWACREAGLFENAVFESWYIRFIAHFIRVYHSSAPSFARSAARWSADPRNIKRYRKQLARGKSMEEIIGKSELRAFNDIPAKERNDPKWPYRTLTLN